MTIAERLRREGIKEGIKEGMKEGAIETMNEVARNMLLSGEDDRKIMKYTKLTKEELTEIKRSLKS